MIAFKPQHSFFVPWFHTFYTLLSRRSVMRDLTLMVTDGVQKELWVPANSTSKTLDNISFTAWNRVQ